MLTDCARIVSPRSAGVLWSLLASLLSPGCTAQPDPKVAAAPAASAPAAEATPSPAPSVAVGPGRTRCTGDAGCILVAPIAAGDGADEASARALDDVLSNALQRVVVGRVERAAAACKDDDCLQAAGKQMGAPLLAKASLARSPVGWTLSVGIHEVATLDSLGGTVLLADSPEDLTRELTEPAHLWVLAASTPGLPLRPGVVAPQAAAAPIEWIASRPAGVRLGKTEVTLGQYRVCVEAGACPVMHRGDYCEWERADREGHPVNCVDHEAATAFCAWAGGRLPTASEWFAEATAAGTRRFPWGGDPARAADDALLDCAHAVWGDSDDPPRRCGHQGSAPVCSLPAGNSVSGLCDVLGNVWEWTRDDEGARTTLRGGSWKYNRPLPLLPADRGAVDNFPWWGDMGLRCAREDTSK